MSFRINTNVNAMTALNNLNNTSDSLSTSIQRLSTGLRINSAADDPSGLIAGMKYQAQLTGISQAISNSQDATNFAKTADGALGEVNSLLNTARGLAVAASNTGVLSTDQVAADNQQLQSIVSSINRISANTQFGTKNLLDGSSGVQATVTDTANVAAFNLGSTFNGAALTAGGNVTATVTTAATQATITLSGTFATTNSFTLNGVTFQQNASTTSASLVSNINAAASQTGVTAAVNGTSIVLKQNSYGSNSTISFTQSGSALTSTAAAGTDAVAKVTIGSASVTFTGGQNGADGLTLKDGDGNTLNLTTAGNTTTTVVNVGQVSVGTSQFQIGANAGQTTSLSLGNFSSSQLGGGAVAGLNMSNIDLNSASDAGNAMKVIDAAISQVTSARGQIGAFQADTLNANTASLQVAQQNLSSTYSSIMNTDVAAEMTNFSKLQIVQQAGMSVLAQANSMPQMVLKLLP